MTAVAERSPATVAVVAYRRKRIRWGRAGLHLFLIAMSALWLFPLVYAVYTSLRPYSDTAERGYASLPGVLNLDNYATAWTQGQIPHYFINTLIIVVPGVAIVIFLASMVAFTVSRFKWRFNLALLMFFTAANLLPAQVVITPLYRLYLALPLPAPLSDNGVFYNQYFGVMVIHVAYQLGFCVFVLSNFMKTIPAELTEAAVVDGAPIWKIFWSVTLPLCKPALAALATLEFTFMYNDFFWALILIFTGSKLPVTSALNNLKGEFFVNNNLVAAGAVLVALPTLIVYFALQRQFISGLTLGSTKG
jgi:multiple sugar transport system permease protein